jgi:tryptophanyl-tRNA synthetase
MLSGIQPSGVLTLGNYLGALKSWSQTQYDYDCLWFVADLHSITVPQDPKTLSANTRNVILQYAACGIDFDANIVFLQSHVPEHAQLAWTLNCCTYMGELSQMTQFKEKSRKQSNTGNSVSVGLFDYPVLMAADILIYDSDWVPVGEDQRQHLELARNLAKRFNAKYGDTFVIPEGYIPEAGARIMSLQNPVVKMSKSDPNQNSFVTLLDSREDVIKKFRKAVTDSGDEIRFDDDKPGIRNLINIYSATKGCTITDVENEFAGCSYSDFKAAVGEVVADLLVGIQTKYHEFSAGDKYEHLGECLADGAATAQKKARSKIDEVYEKIGFMARL